MFQFDVQVVPPSALLQALLASVSFYAIYYVAYKTRLRRPDAVYSGTPLFSMNKTETRSRLLLAAIAVATAGIFFMENGLLLFKLKTYSQIFSSGHRRGVKALFYFFIPAMLVVFFLKPTFQRWIFFLITTVAFGIMTYVIVGGTRANIIIAFALFLFIGIVRGWISLWMLVSAGVFGVVGMFWLALKRYSLDVSGAEAFYVPLSDPRYLLAVGKPRPAAE